jgi:hypothetical protein
VDGDSEWFETESWDRARMLRQLIGVGRITIINAAKTRNWNLSSPTIRRGSKGSQLPIAFATIPCFFQEPSLIRAALAISNRCHHAMILSKPPGQPRFHANARSFPSCYIRFDEDQLCPITTAHVIHLCYSVFHVRSLKTIL